MSPHPSFSEIRQRFHNTYAQHPNMLLKKRAAPRNFVKELKHAENAIAFQKRQQAQWKRWLNTRLRELQPPQPRQKVLMITPQQLHTLVRAQKPQPKRKPLRKIFQ